jgi:penicillin amidase
LLGERFVRQDAIQRACNVDGASTGLPASDGDWVVDAYLEGLNAIVDTLDEVPPEFARAGSQPRRFTRADVAARYRFTSWFQHKSWTEKMLLGRLMATHGVEYFENHVLHFNEEDRQLVSDLREPLSSLSMASLQLAYPDVSAPAISGSNNWAVTGALSASGKPMLATDPHQPHTIPNTFFYVHLHAGDWDCFGAAFPGVPYFMMGYTREIAWGLTTGFVDCYDIFIEQINNDEYLTESGWQPLHHTTHEIAIKGGDRTTIDVVRTGHGPLLESLTDELAMTQELGMTDQLGTGGSSPAQFATALYWSLTDVPTSAGALAQLPLATTAAEFGEKLFEENVCPLVNNIICVDKDNGLRRFIATTLPVREGVTGSVPLPGWQDRYDFAASTRAQLSDEIDPDRGFALTANNDTMGERGSFPIHNFPAGSARADRIAQLLNAGGPFTVRDFEAAQLDLKDLRAVSMLPDLIEVLAASDAADVRLAIDLLRDWDCVASIDSAAACLFYPFLDQYWPRRFMQAVLDDSLLAVLPGGAPGLNRFDIANYLAPGSPWRAHRPILEKTIATAMCSVVENVRASLGADPGTWHWGDLHKIRFAHRLVNEDSWSHMSVGPDAIGGSPTTLGMAMHMGPGPGKASGEEIACRVYHGPAYRLVVDLADPDHARFVIAGGNGGRHDSEFAMNQYPTWLAGECYDLSLLRAELSVREHWVVRASG